MADIEKYELVLLNCPHVKRIALVLLRVGNSLSGICVVHKAGKVLGMFSLY